MRHFLLLLSMVIITSCSSNKKKEVYEPLSNGDTGYMMHYASDSVKKSIQNLSFCNIYLNRPFDTDEWLSKNDSICSHIEPFTQEWEGEYIGNVYKLYIHSKGLDVEVETFGDVVMRIAAKSDKRDENILGSYLNKYGEFNCEEIINESMDFKSFTWEYKNQSLRVFVGKDGTNITYIDKILTDSLLNYQNSIIEKKENRDKEINNEFEKNI